MRSAITILVISLYIRRRDLDTFGGKAAKKSSGKRISAWREREKPPTATSHIFGRFPLSSKGAKKIPCGVAGRVKRNGGVRRIQLFSPPSLSLLFLPYLHHPHPPLLLFLLMNASRRRVSSQGGGGRNSPIKCHFKNMYTQKTKRLKKEKNIFIDIK